MTHKDPFQDLEKMVDSGIKYAKAAIVVIFIGGLAIAGLVSWVVIHFLTKLW